MKVAKRLRGEETLSSLDKTDPPSPEKLIQVNADRFLENYPVTKSYEV